MSKSYTFQADKNLSELIEQKLKEEKDLEPSTAVSSVIRRAIRAGLEQTKRPLRK